MPRPSEPEVSKREAIQQGLDEYRRGPIADDFDYVAEHDNNLAGMRQVGLALYERHLDNLPPGHDARDCRHCHDFAASQEENHDRSRCRVCLKEDADYIKHEETEQEEPAAELDREQTELAERLLELELFGSER